MSPQAARAAATPTQREHALAPMRIRLRVAQHGAVNRLLLVRGTLDVQFDCQDIGSAGHCYGEPIVVTPPADLGCVMTLGRTLRVQRRARTGQRGAVRARVGALYSLHGVEIPAGARMSLYSDGPRNRGTPYFESASAAFIQAVHRLDRGPDKEALAALLREARRKDSLTPWHLWLDDARQREAVSRRLQQLVPRKSYVNDDQEAAERLSLIRETWR